MDQDTALGMMRAALRLAGIGELETRLVSLITEALALTGARDGYAVLLNSGSPTAAVQCFGIGGRTAGNHEAAIKAACERALQHDGMVTVTPKDTGFDGFGLKAEVILWAPFASRGGIQGGLVLANPPILSSRERLDLFLAFVELAGVIVSSGLILDQLAARTRYLADYDDLVTKLPNRVFFKRSVGEAIPQASPQRQVALLFLDLDDFESINRKVGHNTGDLFLFETAQRLQQVAAGFQPSPFVARLGGDEFGVLLWPVAGEELGTKLAAMFVEDFRKPLVVGQHRPRITASIGITLCSEPTQTVEALLWQADQAMYTAKSRGKNTYCLHPASQEGSAGELQAVPTGPTQE